MSAAATGDAQLEKGDVVTGISSCPVDAIIVSQFLA